MTVTEFLLKSARDRYVSLDDLYTLAVVDLLRLGEGKREFLALISGGRLI